MYYSKDTLIPIISSNEYDEVAQDFLERYFPQALSVPQPVPILDVARNNVGLDVQFVRLSEELDVYGITVFSDGLIDIYDETDELYDSRFYKRKTVLIDPEAYKKTNHGCVNNTIAHECVHWFKHRMYYKMQDIILPKSAKYCKCSVNQLQYNDNEIDMLESQATGIAPRILMPYNSFIEKARDFSKIHNKSFQDIVSDLSEFFRVSKASVSIRLSECNLI